MNPEQIALAHSLITLLDHVGAGSVVTILTVGFFAPWIVLVFISFAQHRRFESVVRMYGDNVRLVEDTLNLAGDFRRLSESSQEVVAWVGQEVSKMNTMTENNMHCPIVRKGAKPRDIQE